MRGHLQGQPNKQVLDELNARLKALGRFGTLEPGADGYAWCHEITPAYPQSVLAPIVFAAARLLQSAALSRLKSRPPPEGCGWLSVDRSRNGSRTWCNMKTCGNVVKQRRHRARHGKGA